jgi:hypothetical protein
MLPQELQELMECIVRFLRSHGKNGLHKVDLLHDQRGGVQARSKFEGLIGCETNGAYTEEEVRDLATTLWQNEERRIRVVIKYADAKARTGWRIRQKFPRE